MTFSRLSIFPKKDQGSSCLQGTLWLAPVRNLIFGKPTSTEGVGSALTLQGCLDVYMVKNLWFWLLFDFVFYLIFFVNDIIFVVFGDVLCLDSSDTYIVYIHIFCWFGSGCVEPEEWQRCNSKIFLRGGFKCFPIFNPNLGERIEFYQLFSDGLKPPINFCLKHPPTSTIIDPWEGKHESRWICDCIMI